MTVFSNALDQDRRASSSRRWLHLWLPQLSIDRVRRGSPAAPSPLALIAKRDNALRLAALDQAAQDLGLEIGLPLAAARARVPELTVMASDSAADQNLLAAIGEMCRRYTPALALDPPDGVHLDITGAARLFGGERKLTRDLSARMQHQGISVRIGVARTVGLACALARHRNPKTVNSIKALPVAALRLDPQTVGVLHRLGLLRVGQILDLPRPALARRIGEELLQRLDETLGFRQAALTLSPEPLTFCTQHRLTEPIVLESQVLSLCRWLADRLAERLDRRSVGGRVFTLDLFRVDGACKRLVVQAARPLRDPARIVTLFTERLAVLNEGLEADFGFDLLRLTADRVETMRPTSTDFIAAVDNSDFIDLVDRLSVRLGREALRRLAPAADSLIPERAVKSTPFSTNDSEKWSAESPALYDGLPLRPLTLFAPPQPIEVIAGVPEDPPKQFRWRRASHTIVRAEGPERIAQEWWREREPGPQSGAVGDVDVQSPKADSENGAMGAIQPAPDRSLRDYYRVEDDEGRRFWVFREGAFVAGVHPRWFLHGLFP